MLERARMTPGHRCTCAIVIDNGLGHSEWEARSFSFNRGPCKN